MTRNPPDVPREPSPADLRRAQRLVELGLTEVQPSPAAKFTPEEEATYDQLFGPGAPRPTHVSGPMGGLFEVIDEVPGPRVRPGTGWADHLPRSLRRAEVTCTRARRLVAVVLGTDVPSVVVTENEAGSGPVGGRIYPGEGPRADGWLVACRCGWGHVIDRDKLLAELEASPRPSGRPTSLDVQSVERTQPV